MQLVQIEPLLEQLDQKIEAINDELIAFRSHIHQNPELSFQEYETQKFILDHLAQIPHLQVRTVAKTGVLVTVTGLKKSTSPKVIALRCDIDALPIEEQNEVPYKSKNEGVMHACGHDVHTTCVFGALKILAQNRGQWSGTIKAFFQPGEELLPGGATKMIDAGVLQNPTVDRIIGLHVEPNLPVGKIGLRKGRYMASCDELHITLKGSGGHAAMPHLHTDLIAIVSQIIVHSQQIISRKAPPSFPSVLSFGSINSKGGATNVFANELKLEGTFRTYEEGWRQQALHLLELICNQHASAFGAEVDVNIIKGYPALVNDPETTDIIYKQFVKNFDAENIKDLDIRPTAEDFAWYLQKVPGTFFRLGVRNEQKGIVHGVHTPFFDADSKSFKIGVKALVTGALSLL